MTPKQIVVLISVGRHPVSGLCRRSRNDSLALEMGQMLTGHRVTVVHVGNPDEPALRDYLALGAGEIEVLALADGGNVVAALATRLRSADLILCGSRAEGGQASGMLPYLLADALDIPVVSNALGLELRDETVAVQQFLPKGKRRKVEAVLPAVVAVHPLAPVTPRYAFARQRDGQIRVSAVTAARERAAGEWQLAPATRKPQKLKAVERKSGHARMQSAIVSESKGGRVINTGSASEKAKALLAYLREHRLVEF